jgi:hypothetical protein
MSPIFAPIYFLEALYGPFFGVYRYHPTNCRVMCYLSYARLRLAA